MNKNKKIKIAILIGIIITIVLSFIILFPRIKVWFGIRVVYENSFGDNLGLTAKPFTEYGVTDDSLVMVTFPHFTIGLPAYFEDQTREDSEFIIYRTAGTTEENYSDCEVISFKSEGTDNSELVVLNQENIGVFEMSRLIKGYNKLGYGMPDNSYNSLKAAFSITEEDYSFWNYDTSLAYQYLLPARLNGLYFASDGTISHTYFYETKDKCALFREKQIEDKGLYSYVIEVYDSKDLNTGYIISLYVENPERAYAIMNSIQFQ